MPLYIETMDVTKPAGGRDISLGDDDIREMKRGYNERLNTDHVFPNDETGVGTVGYHRKVTLIKQSADPDPVVDAGIFYAKDTGSGFMEAFFIDEAGNITQLTNRGHIARLSKEVIMWFGTIATIPSGLYICDGTGGRPDLRDKFIVGARQDNAGVAQTNVEGSLAQSGTPTHSHGGFTGTTTLTTAQIPSHTHAVHAEGGGGVGGFNFVAVNTSGGPNADVLGAATATGGGTGHDHSIAVATAIPPYFALAFVSPFNQ